MVNLLLQRLKEKKILLYLDCDEIRISSPKNALNKEIIKEISFYKEEIVDFLREEKYKNALLEVPKIKIEKGSPQLLVPLSFSQQRLWFISQLNGLSDQYGMPHLYKVKGCLNYSLLKLAVNEVIRRHDVLKTRFFQSDEDVFQEVDYNRSAFITYDEQPKSIEALIPIISKAAKKRFDLKNDMLLRVHLFLQDDQDHLMLINMHHIVSDGASVTVFLQELSRFYTFFLNEKNQNLTSPRLPSDMKNHDLDFQYSDFCHWQRKVMTKERLETLCHYWDSQLKDLPVVHSLPLDFPRGNLTESTSGNTSLTYDGAFLESIKNCCFSSGVTIFMLVQAVFSIFIYRYGRNSDVVMGSPVSGRLHPELNKNIGLFVNTLVLRSDLSVECSFKEFLRKNSQMLLDAYENQHVPFEFLVGRLNPVRESRINPLFQIVISSHKNSERKIMLDDIEIEAQPSFSDIAKFDVELILIEHEKGGKDALSLSFKYDGNLFSADTISRMTDHFDILFHELVSNPDESFLKARMLSEKECNKFLRENRNTYAQNAENKCLHELFEQQVSIHPDSDALIFEGIKLSYTELNKKANKLAHYLINEMNVKPDMLIGVCIERSLDTVIAILAILKAGGAYVPLDPTYPAERISFMLNDAHLRLVITTSIFQQSLFLDSSLSLCLDSVDIQRLVDTYVDHNPARVGLTIKNLAYVIYTSGSTGTPKGVMIEHLNAVSFLTAMQSEPGIIETDCLLAVTSPSFDIHVLELFLPLIVGAKVVVAANKDVGDPERLMQLINKNSVSIMQATPSTWKMMMDANWNPSLAIKVLCGGEPLSSQLASDLLAHPTVELWNMYGPTETTVWSCVKKISCDEKKIFIGKPIANTALYVLVDEMMPAPVGTLGELYIGGAGVARGYLNRADLTAERFIPNPFSGRYGFDNDEKLYKTGDVVRWATDGNLEFIGRGDQQVKIRGFRIETGEIENILKKMDGIGDAAVLVKNLHNAEKVLLAFITTTDIFGFSLTSLPPADFVNSIRLKLNQVLPGYMVPNDFIIVESMPLTANGKLDKNNLLGLSIKNAESICSRPLSFTEQKLLEIWCNLLGIEANCDANSNFFRLGGNSLMLVKLEKEIRLTFGVSPTLSRLFEHQVLADLSSLINNLENSAKDKN